MTNVDDLIKRPDGSYVRLSEQSTRTQLSHELTLKLFPMGEEAHDGLVELKKLALLELRAHRDMMFTDHGLKIMGKEGGFSVRTVCGTKFIRLEVSKTLGLGPEIEVAQRIIEQFFELELEGSSDVIQEFVSGHFKLNAKGRLNTAGILSLKRKYSYKHPLWLQAMDAIDEAVINDDHAIYVRFYNVDTKLKVEDRVKLNFSEV